MEGIVLCPLDFRRLPENSRLILTDAPLLYNVYFDNCGAVLAMAWMFLTWLWSEESKLITFAVGGAISISLSLWSRPTVGPPGRWCRAHRARFFITWPRGVQKPQPRSRRAVHHWPAIRGISAAAYAEYAPRQHHNNLTEREIGTRASDTYLQITAPSSWTLCKVNKIALGKKLTLIAIRNWGKRWNNPIFRWREVK